MIPICIPDLKRPSAEVEALCNAVCSDMNEVIEWLEKNRD